MKIGVFGSGGVAQAVGGKLVELGHAVVFSSRTPEKLAGWLAAIGGGARAGSAAEAAAHGDLLINATQGGASLEVLAAAGAENLNGKILIDIANPLDFAQGFPPSLFVANTDSLGEQIQRSFPEVKVVKTLNTVSAPLMVNPRQLADGDHTLFISGNDTEAKAQVTTWLREWFGWSQIFDLGDITTARGSEMLLALWVRLFAAQGTPIFNVKIVR